MFEAAQQAPPAGPQRASRAPSSAASDEAPPAPEVAPGSSAPNSACSSPPPAAGAAREHEHAPGQPQRQVELRFLVRRREAGALIGKRGANIKRLRDQFRASQLSIPDSGNGPERVVCLAAEPAALEPLLAELARVLLDKAAPGDDQIELKLLIHSSRAGSLIGLGGQSIKKLRNDSKAAIKIYELCCPLSSERVCAIKARPAVVVATVRLVQALLAAHPIKGTVKPYDALNFDLALVDKYGGFAPDELAARDLSPALYEPHAAACAAAHYAAWPPAAGPEPAWPPPANCCGPAKARFQPYARPAPYGRAACYAPAGPRQAYARAFPCEPRPAELQPPHLPGHAHAARPGPQAAGQLQQWQHLQHWQQLQQLAAGPQHGGRLFAHKKK